MFRTVPRMNSPATRQTIETVAPFLRVPVLALLADGPLRVLSGVPAVTTRPVPADPGDGGRGG
nr:hypothetical protein GCM10020092_008840 [Actinoplanes digitatis]